MVSIAPGLGPVVPNILMDLPVFDVSKYKQAGDPDDTLSLQRAAAALQSKGFGRLFARGALSVKPPIAGSAGNTYTKGLGLCIFQGLTGVVLDLAQAPITDTQTYTDRGGGTGDWAELFEFDNCALIETALNVTTASQKVAYGTTWNTKGLHTLSLVDGTHGVRARTIINGGLRAINITNTNPGVAVNPYDIEVDTLATNAEYALNVALGVEQLRGITRAITCWRPFIAYGLADADISLWTQDIYGQIAIDSLNSNGVMYGIENVKIRWYDRTSTGIAVGGNPCAISFQGTIPGTIRNLELVLDILATGNYGRLIGLSKFVSNGGAADNTGRGHTIDGLKLSGRVDQTDVNWPVLLTDQGTFTSPDLVNSLTIAGLQMVGNVGVVVSAVGCVGNGKRWIVRDSYADGPITLHNGASGQQAIIESTAPNLTPWDASWVGSTDLVVVEHGTTPDPPLTHNLISNSSGTVNNTGYTTTGPAWFIATAGASVTALQTGVVSNSSLLLTVTGAGGSEGWTWDLGSPTVGTALTLTIWMIPTSTTQIELAIGEAGPAWSHTTHVPVANALNVFTQTWTATGNHAYACLRVPPATATTLRFEAQVEAAATGSGLVQTPTVASGIRPLAQTFAVGGAVVGD